MKSGIKKVYIICPVRNITKKQKETILKYYDKISKTCDVYLPFLNNIKNILKIYKNNIEALIKADEVHIFWSNNSKGSIFDLAISFVLNKKMKLIKVFDKIDSEILKIIKGGKKLWKM